jgi:hypothetical protein
VQDNPLRVRIEVRKGIQKHRSIAKAKTTATTKAKTPMKEKEKTLIPKAVS